MPDGAASIEDVLAGRARWRVECADALALLPTLPAGCVDAVVADPPYMIGAASVGNDNRAKIDGWADLQNAAHWYAAWMSEARRVLRPTGHLLVFGNWRGLPCVMYALSKLRWNAASCIVWDKQWIGPGQPRAFRPRYELVLHAAMPDGVIADRGLPDVMACRWMAGNMKTTEHPAEKPVALLADLVGATTSPGGLVFDPFVGSGTTGKACLGLGRRFIGAEMSEDYAALARARLEKADTGGPLFAAPQADLFGGDKEAS